MEQERTTQPTPSTSLDEGRVQTRRSSTAPEQLPMKKIFKYSHSLRDRYICQEKVVNTGKACKKSYKQKSGIVRHLKNAHKGKSFSSARLKIIDRKDLQYKMKDNYAQEHQEKDLVVDEVVRLVETYGEEVYVVRLVETCGEEVYVE